MPPLADILITHDSPLALLDDNINLGKLTIGYYALLKALWHMRPIVHVFGHIHVGKGVLWIRWDAMQMTYEEVCARRVRSGLASFLWQKMKNVVSGQGKIMLL
jgi:hypothetical protein